MRDKANELAEWARSQAEGYEDSSSRSATPRAANYVPKFMRHLDASTGATECSSAGVLTG